VGAGEAVLGSFSFAAQAGVSAGASIGSYGAAGTAGGFVSGAGMAGLSGGNANFYTFNGQERLDFGYQNMGWRWMDNLTGRMNGIDPMHQFDSGYTGLGNNPVARIDPDGRIAPLVIAGAALVGGAINLASNWSKVKGDWRAGTAYFLSGAVGGVVGLSNVYAGGGITSGANAAIDIATGNMPQLNSVADKAAYVAQGAIIGLGTAVVGAEVGKLIGPQLSKAFSWSQTTFANTTQQTVMIGNQAYTYFLEAGVKLSKSWFGSVGAQVGNAAGQAATKQATKGVTAPKGWITQASKKGGGTVFKDPSNPHNIIRQMPGNSNSPNLLQQNPYVKFMKEGKFYDVNGKVLPNGDVPGAHIPLNQFYIKNMPKF
jgi:RHS repeat-associated protein